MKRLSQNREKDGGVYVVAANIAAFIFDFNWS